MMTPIVVTMILLIAISVTSGHTGDKDNITVDDGRVCNSSSVMKRNHNRLLTITISSTCLFLGTYSLCIILVRVPQRPKNNHRTFLFLFKICCGIGPVHQKLECAVGNTGQVSF